MKAQERKKKTNLCYCENTNETCMDCEFPLSISIPRKPHHKQDTPRMQLCALVQAAQGDLLNILGGITNPRQFPRTQIFLQEAQEILRKMPEGEWEKMIKVCGVCGRKCRKNETLDQGKCFNCGGEWSETIMVRKTPSKNLLRKGY